MHFRNSWDKEKTLKRFCEEKLKKKTYKELVKLKFRIICSDRIPTSNFVTIQFKHKRVKLFPTCKGQNQTTNQSPMKLFQKTLTDMLQ